MENKETIVGISEAFSMQPAWFYIGTEVKGGKIARIEHEIVTRYKMGDPYEEWYYIGYDASNQKLFAFLATSVNVFYKPLHPID